MNVRKIKIRVGSKPVGRAVTWAYPEGNKGPNFEIPTYKVTVSGKDDRGIAGSKDFEAIRFGVQQKTASSSPRVVGLADRQTHTIKKWNNAYEVHSAGSVENGAWQVYKNFLVHDGPDDPLDATEPYASIGCVEICGDTQSFVKFNDFILSLSGVKLKSRNKRLKAIGSSKKLSISYEKAERPALKSWKP